MADRIEVLLEAERRGILPAEKREALAEARKRGLVPLAPVPMDALRPPERVPEASRESQWGMVGNDLRNAAKGLYRGLEGTAQAGAQLVVRNPGMLIGGSVAEALGQPDPMASIRQSVDDQAAASARTFQESPAGQSLAGKTGQFVGEVASTGPLGVAAVPARGAGLTSFITRSAAAGASGAAFQPVTEGDFGKSKLYQLVMGGTAGVGVAGGGRGLMALAERVGYAPNALAQLANVSNRRANGSRYALEGEQLATRTGVRMTPGQVSGGRIQTGLENMSRQSVFSADLAAQADTRVAEDAIAYINRTMDKISRDPASAATVGAEIQAATKSSVGRILTKREEVASQQFGAIERALAGRRFVGYDRTRKVLDDLVREYQGVATPEADRIVAQATAMRERLNGQHTLDEFQRQRSYFGRASQGDGSVFDDVNRSVNQRTARRIYAAMSDDLDVSASRLEGNVGAGIVPANFFDGQLQSSGGLAQALKEANANYRRFSQLAEGVKAHPIARLFGKDVRVDGEDWFNTLPPETVVSRLGNMSPTEIRMVRQYMEGASPEAWQSYKRLLVQNALDAAQTLPASHGARSLPFSAGTFLRTLGGDKPAKVRQLHEVFSAEEMAEIDDAFDVARRMGDSFGRNNSGTGPYNEVQSFLQSIRQRSVEAVASTGGEILGLRKIANVMLNSDGRRALIELSRLPPESRQAASLAGFLAGVMAGKQPVQPNEADGQQRQDGRGY